MNRDQAQAAVHVDRRAVESAWASAPHVIVSTPAIKVTLWRDGTEDRITVMRRGES